MSWPRCWISRTSPRLRHWKTGNWLLLQMLPSTDPKAEVRQDKVRLLLQRPHPLPLPQFGGKTSKLSWTRKCWTKSLLHLRQALHHHPLQSHQNRAETITIRGWENIRKEVQVRQNHSKFPRNSARLILQIRKKCHQRENRHLEIIIKIRENRHSKTLIREANRRLEMITEDETVGNVNLSKPIIQMTSSVMKI